MISVLMSVYKENIEWVKKSVDSILNQTYSDFEFIIVIDNPTLDGEVNYYLSSVSAADQRVHLIYNETNVGLAMSLNKALEFAKGQFIARMDADDISFHNRFEEQISFMIEHQCDMVFTNRILIDEKGNVIQNGRSFPKNIEFDLHYGNCVVHPSVLIKAEAIKKCGGYRNFKRSQDYDLWLRLLSNNCKIMALDEYLIYYRISSTNLSNKHKLEQFYVNRYQRKLYEERKRTGGRDSFSEDDIEKYLKRKKITQESNEKALRCFDFLEKIKNGDSWGKSTKYMLTAFSSKPNIFIMVMCNSLRRKLKL